MKFTHLSPSLIQVRVNWISWHKSNLEYVAGSPVLPSISLNLILVLVYMLASHHLYHLEVADLLSLVLLIAQFIATFEVIIAFYSFGQICLSFPAIRIGVDVLIKLNHSSLLMMNLSFYLVFILPLILECEVLFLWYFWVRYQWLREMSLLFMVNWFNILCPLNKILNARAQVIFFIVLKRLNWRWPTFLSLNQLMHTWSC